MNQKGITLFLTEAGQEQIIFSSDNKGTSFGEKWQRIDFELVPEKHRFILKFQKNLFGDQRHDFVDFIKNADTDFLKLFKNTEFFNDRGFLVATDDKF